MAVISAADKGLAVERNGISLTCCVVAEGGEPGALAASAAVRPGLAGGPEPAGILMLGPAAQPQAANKAADHEHAARAASGHHGDGPGRAGAGDTESGPEDCCPVDMTALRRVTRKPQRASEFRAAATAEQGQPEDRDGHGRSEDGIQVPAAEQERLVDRRIVAEPAGGQQEPECQPHSGGAEPSTAVHRAPLVRACAAKVTATATPKNVPVAARESGEPMEQPARPCPLVQPPAQREPYPSARPATVTSGSRTATGKLWDRTG